MEWLGAWRKYIAGGPNRSLVLCVGGWAHGMVSCRPQREPGLGYVRSSFWFDPFQTRVDVNIATNASTGATEYVDTFFDGIDWFDMMQYFSAQESDEFMGRHEEDEKHVAGAGNCVED